MRLNNARSIITGSWKGLILGLLLVCSPLGQDAIAQEDPVTARLPHSPRTSTELVKTGTAVSPLASAFDITYYHLTLNLDAQRDPILVGRVRVEGRSIGPVDSLVLDLSDDMTLDIVFSSTGDQLMTRHEGNMITIALSTPLQPGESFGMDVVYHGNPADVGFGSFETGVRAAGDPYIWTLSEPYGAKEWWPSEDHPSDKADSVRITVTVPEPLVVGSNGLLQSEVHHLNNTVTFDWMHRYPIASYLVSIAAGDYERRVDMYVRPQNLRQQYGSASFPIEHYAFRGSPAYEGINAASGWRLTSEAMAVLEDWFGPYPFAEEKYGNAHVTFRGGMEHQTLSSMGNIGIELISHELAHQWFGDKITPFSWRDLWLNEGFATMGEMLVFESNPDFSSVGLFLSDLYFHRARLSSGTLVLADTTDIFNMFSFPRVYAKGWTVLRMIRGMTGDAVFREILRTYARSPGAAYGGANTKDFQDVVEQVTSRSYQAFFDQWVYSGTGYPTYSATIEDISTGSGNRARIILAQTQEPDVSNIDAFEMRVWLQIRTTVGSVLYNVENTLREQTYEVDLPGAPLAVEVDPERWILRGDAASATTLVEEGLPGHLSVSIYPNPTRSIIGFRVDAPLGARPIAELYDILGRRLWTRAIGRAGGVPIYEVIDDIRLPAGTYLLRVRSERTFVDRVVTIIR